MAFDDVVRALDAERNGLSTQEIQRLLLHLADVAGFLPQQVVGPELRVRWFAWGDAAHSSGRLLQVWCDWDLSAGAVVWNARPEVLDAPMLVEDEHATLKHAADPDSDGRLHYLWNLRVTGLDPQSWQHDLLSPIQDWHAFEWLVGVTLASLPMDLTALPVAWFDGTFTARDESLGLWSATASRHGLDLRQCRSIPDPADPRSRTSEECDYHLTPRDAFLASAYPAQLLMSQLSPDFAFSDIHVSGGQRNEPFSGFLTPRDAPGSDASDRRRLRLGTNPPDPHDWLRERERLAESAGHEPGDGPDVTGTDPSAPPESPAQQDISQTRIGPEAPQSPAAAVGKERKPWWKLW